jgi:heme oxygenase (biliverdin-IX-beta and delta-forming)
MSSSSVGKHAGAGSASDQPAVPEPSFAERARTLVYLARIGSLSTVSRKQPGFPFGSVMPYGLDEHGRPIFLISTMAIGTIPRSHSFRTPIHWRTLASDTSF